MFRRWVWSRPGLECLKVGGLKLGGLKVCGTVDVADVTPSQGCHLPTPTDFLQRPWPRDDDLLSSTNGVTKATKHFTA